MNYITLNLKTLSKRSLHNISSKGAFFSFISLLFVFVLLFSSIVSVFNGFSVFVSGAESVQVGTQTALRSAINAANGPTSIVLTADIVLTDSTLDIPAGKGITLVSDKTEGFWKLVGVANQYTITVAGSLVLDGVIVTHVTGMLGGGVLVSGGGEFIMSGGEISGNENNGSGGGVYVYPDATFVMSGGTIVNNTALYGGGVSMGRGSFVMYGGTIANNTAYYNGGGVEMVPDNSFVNGGYFDMSGGIITSNTVRNGLGGGVYVWAGSFVLSGNGMVTNNTATSVGGSGVFVSSGSFILSDNGVVANNTGGYGVYVSGAPYNHGSFDMKGGMVTNNPGGVYINSDGTFTMSDGMITNNTATNGGGVYLATFSSFTMSGGTIANNTASGLVGGSGGGVYVDGSFVMSGGTITNNAAISSTHGGGGSGGGVFVSSSSIMFTMSGGTIANNVASINGGGIWVTNTNAAADFKKLVVEKDAVFSGNSASEAYSRDSAHDEVYNAQIKGTRWTSPFTQGYNNYDISYTAGVSLTTYSVSVSNSYAASSGAGNYRAGDSVTINAGTREGYTFSGWTVSEGSAILTQNAATTTFTMPARDVAFTATWTPTSGGNDGNNGNDGQSPKPSTSAPIPSTPTPNPSHNGGSDNNKVVWVIGGIALLIVLVIVVLVVVVFVVLVVLLLRRKPKT